jgi:hypothetical protein
MAVRKLCLITALAATFGFAQDPLSRLKQLEDDGSARAFSDRLTHASRSLQHHSVVRAAECRGAGPAIVNNDGSDHVYGAVPATAATAVRPVNDYGRNRWSAAATAR